MMRKPWWAAFALTALLSWAVPASAQQSGLVAAVLPASRAVAVNATATAFATIINTSSSNATGCSVGLPSSVPATFSYQTTDPATNQVTGTPNTPVNLGPGTSQTFVFGIKPTATFSPNDIPMVFSCTSGQAAAPIVGVNTFLLTSSAMATPDIVALAATVSNDGIIRTPGTTANAAFGVATINVGAAGTVTASVDTGAATVPASFSICQTNAQAQCLQSPAQSVDATFAANQTGTFSIFVSSTGTVIPLDPATNRAFVRFKVSGPITVGATSVAVQTQTMLGAGGGSLQLGPVNVQAGTATTVVPTEFSATAVPDPAPTPSGTTSLNSSYNISASNNAGLFNNGLNGPVYMTVPYSGLGVTDPRGLQVLHYDSNTGQYAPTTLQNIDRNTQTVSFDSRQFSIFTLVRNTGSDPATFTVKSGDRPFSPDFDGFKIKNPGNSYLAPGGNCLGMSAFARYFLKERFPQTLFGHYSATTPQPFPIEQLVAMRAHLNQVAYWRTIYTQQTFLFFGSLLAYQRDHPDETVAYLKHNLSVFNEPIATNIGNASAPDRHTILAYGYDANNIFFYDPNCPAFNCPMSPVGMIKVPYSAAGIGTYTGPNIGIGPVNQYDIINHPSFGGKDSFDQIANEADAGFVASANLSVTSPQQNDTINARQVHLTGSLGGNLNQSSQVAYWLNGSAILGIGAVSNGSFDQLIDVAGGMNTLLVIAGVTAKGGQFDNTLANAATVARQYTGPPDAVFRSTLTWAQNNTDVDQYVTEPGASGDTTWYAHRITSSGLTLDFDNTTGLGPENTTIPAGSTPLPGNYTVRVHYYSDHGTGLATNGFVVIRLYEHDPVKYKERTFNWALSRSGAQGANCCNDAPGSTGPDWFTIDTVNVAGDTIN
jgi:uncharacterized protein YfaP (DUF2135 family)